MLARGGADAALVSSFGSLLCLLLVLRARNGSPLRVVWASLAAAALLTLVWAAIEAVQMAGSTAALPLVLRDTVFGHVVLARLVLLACAAAALRCRAPALAVLAAGLALASQAGHGHAMAMSDGASWPLLSEVLHLLAAGAWLGGLLPLALFVAAAPADAATLASRRFAPLGTICVLVIAGTALFQSSILIGGSAGLIGTAYGLVALFKLLLFVTLIGFATRNRFRLTPALHATEAKAALTRSIAVETGVGLLVVLAAGLLTSLAPSMHEQPTWPLPERLSLDAVSEEPEFLREVLLAGGAILATAILAGAALLLRWRWRVAFLGLFFAALWRAAPHLTLLLAPASPTYYWSSPTEFASASIVEGAALYKQHCAACHGPTGHGDGPAAASLPADLTAEHLWAHPDGELFWWLSHGIEGPAGGLVMPGFAATLTETQRWALIDYIRANNAGQARSAQGGWPRPTQAPQFSLTCKQPERNELTDLRGTVVRLVFGPAQPLDGVRTVAVDPATAPGDLLCVASDEAVAGAYAIVTGQPQTALAGQQVLIDGQGWLRAILPAAPPQTIAAIARAIDQQKLTASTPGHAGMKM